MNVASRIEPLYLHPHGAANEAVTLHKGPIRFPDTGKGPAEGSGTLALRWLPATGLRLDAELTSGYPPEPGTRVRAHVANSVAETLIDNMSIGVRDGTSFVRVSGSVSLFERGSGSALTCIGFQVVNFSDFLTAGPSQSPVFGYPPCVADLEHDGWRIRLSAVKKSEQLFKSLGETGGYAFTHVGQVERSDASAFDAQSADGILAALGRLLGFARGAASNVAVVWGIGNNGDVVWERWGSPVVDPWKGRDNWFDEHHGNLLAELFPAFARTLADPDLGEPFSLALHWYQRSNTRAGGMEGAIILGMTALDLLGALVVVDRAGALSASKYDKLPTAAKLAALLKTMKVSPVFPKRCAELTTFASANGWQDPAVGLAEIQHGYVHANKKRRQVVLSAPNLATFQAWWLSLWYQELALLYLLGHQGEYRNRMTAEWLGQVERVPWI